MEIKTQKNDNTYDHVEIKCPYCFKTFHHHEVAFRTEAVSEETIKEYQIKAATSNEAELYKKKLDNAKFYQKQKDSVWHEYWRKMGYDDQSILYENGDGYDLYMGGNRPSVLKELSDPIIGLEKDKLIGPKIIDADGFVIGARDNRGEITKRRVCPHCHNKLPKDYGKYPVKFISIVGISGAGKTVMLTQLIENIGDYIVRAGGDITFDSSDSAKQFTLQNRVKYKEKLPLPTTRSHFSPPLYMQFSRPNRNQLMQTTLVIYDIAGEDCVVADGMDKYGPFVSNSDGIILLVDPEQVPGLRCANNDENRERPQAVVNAMKKAFILGENKKCDIPIAIAYSKSDKMRQDLNERSHVFQPITYNKTRPGFMLDSYMQIQGEIEVLTREKSPAFYSTIRQIFNKYGFFAFSALGNEVDKVKNEQGKEESVVVMNLEPKRLEEPILWLLYQWNLIAGVTNRQEEQKGGFLSMLFGR